MPTWATPVVGGPCRFCTRWGEVAGVGVERLEQAVECTGGDVIDVGLGDVVGLDLLRTRRRRASGGRAILVAAGMHAERPNSPFEAA